MLTLSSIPRRGMMQLFGAGVVGWALPDHRAQGKEQPTGFGQAKSVLHIHLSGGPSQLDMWDMKPESPSEVRGEFRSIPTKVPGIGVCEHMPRLANQMEHWAIARTLAHREHNHLLATHVCLTGRPTPVPRGGTDLDRVESRNDFPNFASALDYVRPPADGTPTGVSLPNYFIEGPLTWPGQHAGFLGAKYDPWQINHDPNDPNFRIQALSMREGVTVGRMQSRRQLLEQLGRDRSLGGDAKDFLDQQEVAINLLTASAVVEAFEIGRESAETRDRYGRNKFGQSLLLARRLIQAGIPVVQAAMGIVQTWDTHTDNWGKLKKTLLPQLDVGLSALMEDLVSSGLLDQTLVVVMGEFGRTPKISTLPGQTLPGRDHWAHVYSGMFAGAGVLGGQVIGQTDQQAAYPVSRSFSPADCLSTVFNALGVDAETQINDPLDRPHHLCNGQVIKSLYTGESV